MCFFSDQLETGKVRELHFKYMVQKNRGGCWYAVMVEESITGRSSLSDLSILSTDGITHE